jgi:uncharacterized membrane protein YhaH (DUF805 family)
MQFFKQLYSFQGRIDRTHYWAGLATVLVLIPLLFALCIGGMIALIMSADRDLAYLLSLAGFALGLILLSTFFLALQVSVMSFAARRLHDIGQSGLWCLFVLLMPSPLMLQMSLSWLTSPTLSDHPAPGFVMIAASAVVVLAGLIVLGRLRGRDRAADNSSDPQAKAQEATAPSFGHAAPRAPG